MSNDFAMFAGDTKVLVVPVVDENTGEVVPLDGVLTIRWHLSKNVNKRPALLTKGLSNGITVTNAPGGIFEVSLDSADTEDLRGEFYHEAEIIDEDDNVSTVVSGTITIEPTLIKPVAP